MQRYKLIIRLSMLLTISLLFNNFIQLAIGLPSSEATTDVIVDAKVNSDEWSDAEHFELPYNIFNGADPLYETYNIFHLYIKNDVETLFIGISISDVVYQDYFDYFLSVFWDIDGSGNETIGDLKLNFYFFGGDPSKGSFEKFLHNEQSGADEWIPEYELDEKIKHHDSRLSVEMIEGIGELRVEMALGFDLLDLKVGDSIYSSFEYKEGWGDTIIDSVGSLFPIETTKTSESVNHFGFFNVVKSWMIVNSTFLLIACSLIIGGIVLCIVLFRFIDKKDRMRKASFSKQAPVTGSSPAANGATISAPASDSSTDDGWATTPAPAASASPAKAWSPIASTASAGTATVKPTIKPTVVAPKIKCPNCGNPVDVAWIACPACAQDLQVKCPSCNAPIVPGCQKCPNCQSEFSW